LRNTPREWVDRDHRFFHATFTILCDFVENEFNGVDGLHRYITSARKQINETSTDAQNQMVQQSIDAHAKMLELYNWYQEIDWQEPVKPSPAYREMLDKVQYHSEPVDSVESGAYRLVETGVDRDAIARERAMHVVREQQFEKIKLLRLHELCNIYTFFWN
jgi:hypothetical protein